MVDSEEPDPNKGPVSTCDGCQCGVNNCTGCDKGGVIRPRSLVVSGKCQTCVDVIAHDESAKPVIPPDQLVKCRGCKQDFHAYGCTGTENQYCLKSLCKTFSANSTPSNFVFFCDPCLTKFELDQSNADMQRVSRLESRMVNFESLILSKLEILSTVGCRKFSYPQKNH